MHGLAGWHQLTLTAAPTATPLLCAIPGRTLPSDLHERRNLGHVEICGCAAQPPQRGDLGDVEAS